MRHLKRFIMVMILASLLLAIPSALAQEEATADTEPAAAVPGITTGVLLIGLVGVVFVGGAIIVRDSFSPEAESE